MLRPRRSGTAASFWDAAVYRAQNIFALRVKGDSMKDAGILSGDLAICEPRQYAQNGEVVVGAYRQRRGNRETLFFT